MRLAIVVAMAMVLGTRVAHADGVILLTPLKTPLKVSDDLQRQLRYIESRPDTGSVVFVKVNQVAIESKVIIVQIEGQDLRYIGGVAERFSGSANTMWTGALEGAPKNDLAYEMILNVSNGREVSGTIYVRGQLYELVPPGFLVKKKAIRIPTAHR